MIRYPTPFILWAAPCFGGSITLPPVICNSYTGRAGAWLSLGGIRGQFLDSFPVPIDAPDFIPAGSHRAPEITVGGNPLIARPHSIYPLEIAREGMQ